MRDEDSSGEPLIAEVVGLPLKAHEVAAAIALGSIALLIAGVMVVLLGALADEGRLSAAGIGQVATLEGLAMGLAAGLAGLTLKPERLRLIGAAASTALALLDFATMQVSGDAILLVRGLAGIPEGLLLWIAIGMIARTQTPERWSAVFITVLTAAQCLLSLAYTLWILPAFNANGGYASLGIVTLAGIAIAYFAPRRYAPLPKPENESQMPPLRGWAALAATFVYTAALAAVGVYLQPIAHEIGLDADVVRQAVTVSLVGQVLGGSLAVVLAGRVKYFTVFLVSTASYAAAWAVFALPVSAFVFVALNGFTGLILLLLTPFFVPMAIEADPSLRAGVLSGAVQVIAGAIGPLLASFAVDDQSVRGVLWLGAAMLLAGMAMIAALHVHAVSVRKAALE